MKGPLRFVIAVVVTTFVVVAVFWITNEYGRGAASRMHMAPTDDAVLGAAVALALAAGTGCLTGFRTLYLRPRHPMVPPVSAVPAAEPPPTVLFGLVPQEAHAFQQRPFETGQLRGALSPAVVRFRPSLVALIGQRGVGKSQLAAAYARDCAAAGYHLVAWITANASLVDSMARLAEALGVEALPEETPASLAAKVRPLLERSDNLRRLIVFDDADEPDDIAAYLPAVGHAEVMVTTNERRFGDADGLTVIPVGMFTVDQGRSFLQSATGRPDDVDALAVGTELGWLPLALAQAAALIHRQHYSYARYLDLLRTSTLDEALPHIAGGAHADGAVRAALLTIDDLSARNTVAERLLEVLSLLGPDGVRRQMIINGAGRHAFGAAPQVLRGAVNDLADASLISYGDFADDHEGVSLLVHRVTARVVRERAVAAGRLESTVATAARLLGAQLAALPRESDAVRAAELNELVTQVQELRAVTGGADPEVLRLCNVVADSLQLIGDLAASATLYEQTLRDRERVLGPDHPDTLTTRKDLAIVYRKAGRLGRAMPLFESTLATFAQVLGPDHPDTLVSRDDLAIWYWVAGRLRQAIELFEQNLADRERLLGPRHPATLGSRNNLALAYADAGRVDEAIAIHLRNVHDTEQVQGADDIAALACRNNLALAYLEAGRTELAIAEFERVVADRERVLGNDHIATLGGRNNLALAYVQDGQPERGLALHVRTLADRDRTLGPEHPNTLGSRNNLALAYVELGRVEQGITLHEQTLAERTRVLGPDHPDVFGSRSNLAIAYLLVDHVSDAVRLLQETLADRRRVMGDDHPETLASAHNLATAQAVGPGRRPKTTTGFRLHRSTTRSVPLPRSSMSEQPA